ncbi:MAG: hypothetical protein GY853_14565 [PVC group bacterium]|nr:hypothetical protein [PVC group bacterium]
MNYFEDERRQIADQAETGYSVTDGSIFHYDEDAILTQPDPVYRIDARNGKRLYLKFEDDELKTGPELYISVTSSIASYDILPMPKGLLIWQAKFETNAAYLKELNKLANYGTICHMCIAMYWRDGGFDLETIPEIIRQYQETHKTNYNVKQWVKKLKRDLMAVNNFAIAHNVKPIANELMLTGSAGYATAVDFICEMDIGTAKNGYGILKADEKNGAIRRVTAIIDWKSNFADDKDTKVFGLSCEFQLEACRRLVSENYPNLHVDKLYNVSFKGGFDSVKGPEVIIKDQTDKALTIVDIGFDQIPVFDLYWCLYLANNPKYNELGTIKDITGYLSPDPEFHEIADCSITLEDIVRERFFNQEKE